MPWKGEKDPYKIWISEVILQQTRVEQGWHYYNRFVERFSTVEELASAPIEDVLKLWQGLGYYRRAKNLHQGAIQVVNEHGGKMPRDIKDIKNISSIGDYTSAAIASFAFDLPHAVVDGNVIRLLARIFGIMEAFETGSGRKYFQTLAEELIDPNSPAFYNQAIMDLGATVCTPALPHCPECPFIKTCFAFLENRISDLPVRSKSIKKRNRHFNYFVFRRSDQVLIFQRKAKDIYEGMYEFYLLETAKVIPEARIHDQIKALSGQTLYFRKIEINKPHILTHQRLHIIFYEINMEGIETVETCGQWISNEELNKLPVPKFIHDYLKRLEG